MFKQSFFFSTCILAIAVIAGCSQDPSSPDATSTSNGKGSDISGKPAASTPNPAFTFAGTASVKGKIRNALTVSDVDYANSSDVYISGSVGPKIHCPTWSTNGGSVSFVEMPALNSGHNWNDVTNWGNYYIKKVDVTVSNSGVSGSNTQTVFTAATADSMKIVSQTWCPSATGDGAGKIAFMVLTPTEDKIFIISTSGGTATEIYSVNRADNRLQGESLTWSNDGNNLAFSQFSGTATAYNDVRWSIEIIDIDGTVQTTLLADSYHIGGLRWSNSGTDQLAFWMTDEVQDIPVQMSKFSIYTIVPTDGSARSLIASQSGLTPCWSPSNSEITCFLYGATPQAIYKVNVASLTTTSLGNVNPADWK